MADPYIPEYNEETCEVCGKGVAGGRGYCRLKHEGLMIELCCPLCVEVFQMGKGIHHTIRECNRLLHPRKTETPTETGTPSKDCETHLQGSITTRFP